LQDCRVENFVRPVRLNPSHLAGLSVRFGCPTVPLIRPADFDEKIRRLARFGLPHFAQFDSRVRGFDPLEVGP
jgi:hypothetical protein